MKLLLLLWPLIAGADTEEIKITPETLCTEGVNLIDGICTVENADMTVEKNYLF
jgi:hypothetical protein